MAKYTPPTIDANPHSAEAWATSEERTPLFSLSVQPTDESGNPIPDAEPELITYTMPAKPNPGLALKYLKKARTMGELAMSWLIEEAIGEEGYDALSNELINYTGDPVALLRGIVEKIQTVAMGGLEGPKA